MFPKPQIEGFPPYQSRKDKQTAFRLNASTQIYQKLVWLRPSSWVMDKSMLLLQIHFMDDQSLCPSFIASSAVVLEKTAPPWRTGS